MGLGVVGRHLEGETVAAGEPGIHHAEPLHGPGEQPRAGQQHHRDRDLRDDQRLLQPLPPPAAGGPLAAERQRGAEGVLLREAGRVGEQQRHHHGEQQGEAQHHRIDPDLSGAGAHPPGERREHSDAAEGDQES